MSQHTRTAGPDEVDIQSVLHFVDSHKKENVDNRFSALIVTPVSTCSCYDYD